VSPFAAVPYFGQSLLGSAASSRSAWIAGFVYHLLNGIFFSAAYGILFTGGRWWFGIVWALTLELAMLALYPSLLDIRAVMQEFTIMSVSGHVAYGCVLGLGFYRTPPIFYPRRH